MRIISEIQDWYREYYWTCEKISKFLVSSLKIKSNSKILELGCGSGAFTIPLALQVQSSKILAVDNNEKILKELRLNIKKSKVKNVVVIKADCRRLGEIEDDSADYVFSHWLSAVITRCNDLKRIFKESYRILKKGGVAAHSESSPVPKIGLKNFI